MLLDAVLQACFVSLGRSLSVAGAFGTDQSAYDCAEAASQSGCEENGVKRGSAPRLCGIVGAAIALVRLESASQMIPDPFQGSAKAHPARCVGRPVAAGPGRGRISAGRAVSIQHSCSDPAHRVVLPSPFARAYAARFALPLLSPFGDTRSFVWIQLFAVHPATRFRERRILESLFGVSWAGARGGQAAFLHPL